MKINRIIDLSQSISEKGFQNPAFADGQISTCMDHAHDGWRAEIITAATHVGTHIDSPLHKLKGGTPISGFPLERFVSEALAIDLFEKQPDAEITFEDLFKYDSRIKENDSILLCTGWGEKKKETTKEEYLYHSPWLGKEAAEYLVEKKVNAVGIDHFSIGGANPKNVEIPHDILLRAGVLIFEGLQLSKELLTKERWLVVAFPLLLENASGAPARIVAMDVE